MFSAYWFCIYMQWTTVFYCLLYPLLIFEIFNFAEEENDWDLSYSQRHSFSIFLLFVALPEFPYLGYKTASSQGTKLNSLWKCALYIYRSFIFCICRYSFAIKVAKEKNQFLLKWIATSQHFPQLRIMKIRSQSETVKKLNVWTINSHSTQSVISWNFSFVFKPSVPEIPYFVIHVVLVNKRRKVLGSNNANLTYRSKRLWALEIYRLCFTPSYYFWSKLVGMRLARRIACTDTTSNTNWNLNT